MRAPVKTEAFNIDEYAKSVRTLILNHISKLPQDKAKAITPENIEQMVQAYVTVCLEYFEKHKTILALTSLRESQQALAANHPTPGVKAEASRNDETTLSRILSAAETISTEEANKLAEIIDSLQLRSKERMKDITAAATTLAAGVQQEGRKSKSGNGTVIRRNIEKHRYTPDRELQLLKQASTLVYFALEKKLKKENLVEVEMMHVAYGNKHFVFVAANETDVSKYFRDIVGNTAESVKQLLTTDIKPAGKRESKIRAKRYSQKLSYRLFGEAVRLEGTNPDDLEKAKAVAETLKQPWKHLDLNARPAARVKALIEAEAGGVFCVDTHRARYKERHAEEWLVDIAEYIQEEAATKGLQVYASICGKKRPCLACTGRMTGVIDHFPAHPGYVWLHSVKNQPTDVRKRSFHTIFTCQSCVTIDGSGNKAPDYGSASDSEGPGFGPAA